MSEQDCRMLVAWAGRKLSKRQLIQLSRAYSKKDTVTFDSITERLFTSQICTQDERLQDLLPADDQLTHFRNVMWLHVAPAIGEYTNLPCDKRIALYLYDLDHVDQVQFEEGEERFRSDDEARELSAVGMVVSGA